MVLDKEVASAHAALEQLSAPGNNADWQGGCMQLCAYPAWPLGYDTLTQPLRPKSGRTGRTPGWRP